MAGQVSGNVLGIGITLMGARKFVGVTLVLKSRDLKLAKSVWQCSRAFRKCLKLHRLFLFIQVCRRLILFGKTFSRGSGHPTKFVTVIPSGSKQPRILVATSNLYSLGLTLHKTYHLVKFDVDLLDGGDCHVLKRIYRIRHREERLRSRQRDLGVRKRDKLRPSE